jgi:CheY-like chemotaxis protein
MVEGGTLPSPVRILVVDDDDVERAILRKLLKRWFQAEITEAENGEQALQKLEAVEPDLIILDVMMPVMDGLQVLTTLRADPRRQSLPVVVITASGEKDHVLKMVKLGVTDYLLKPIEQDIAQNRLSRIVEKIKSDDQ